MTRAIVFLMTLVFVFPSDGSSQTASLGDRIRIRQANGTTLTGTLATVSAAAIQLSVGSSRVGGGIAIPRSQIVTIERQQGTRNKSTLVGTVGLLAGGAIAWATLGDKLTRSCDLPVGDRIFFPDCVGPADYVEGAEKVAGDVVRVLLGMAAGGIVGALVGSAIRTENWVIVPSIEVAPRGQGTSASVFGFGLRFARVGLPW